MALKDTQVRNAKPRAKPYKIPAGGGLYLVVTPSGSKLWRYDYRFSDKRKTLALGAYPDVSCKAAAEAHRLARTRLAEGDDPAAAKQRVKTGQRVAAANTFEAVAREWFAKQRLAPATRAKKLWMLETLTLPWLGHRPIAEIEPSELLTTVLRRIEDAGKLETAHRVKQQCGQIFRYAVATGRAHRDVTADLRGAMAAPKVKHRAALIKPDQVGGLMRAIDGYGGTYVVTQAMKLSALLMARPGEIRHAEWSEIDLDAAQWVIPDSKAAGEGRMKMGGAHVVPLASQAVAILRDLHPLTGAGRYVFPGARSNRRPMSEVAVLAALRRMGYGKDEMTAHGFRAMARSLLAEMGWNPDAIERQLAHKPAGPLGAAYDRAQFLDERRLMMQAWADYLDSLRRGESKVTPIRGRAA